MGYMKIDIMKDSSKTRFDLKAKSFEQQFFNMYRRKDFLLSQ